jgi:hypothetical protein
MCRAVDLHLFHLGAALGGVSNRGGGAGRHALHLLPVVLVLQARVDHLVEAAALG